LSTSKVQQEWTDCIHW